MKVVRHIFGGTCSPAVSRVPPASVPVGLALKGAFKTEAGRASCGGPGPPVGSAFRLPALQLLLNELQKFSRLLLFGWILFAGADLCNLLAD